MTVQEEMSQSAPAEDAATGDTATADSAAEQVADGEPPEPGLAGLIDWSAAFGVAARLVEAGAATAAEAARVEAAAPTFRNKAFELSPLPLFVRGGAYARAVPVLEEYVRLLGKVARLYVADAEIRAWYGLPATAEELIAAEAASGRGADVRVCRLDGYLEQGTERLRVLENNADAPAGTLFTPRVHAVVLAILDGLGIPVPPHAPHVAPRDTALPAVLTESLSASGTARTVAVLQPHAASNVESREMVAHFHALGIDCLVADPREVTAVGGRAVVAGRRIDACWNKVNTVAWEQLTRQDPELNRRWCEILTRTDLVHVNSFASRYVAESKLTLALVQEERFAPWFDARERRLAELVLPWTRRVRADAALTDRIVDEQHRYVLKEPYDIRGDGVTVGRAVTRAAWADAIGRALKGPAVVQQYVAPTAYPVLRVTAGPDGPAVRAVAMPASLDTYLIGGRVAFPGSKAGLQARINVFQGGQKLAVHVTPAEGGA